MALRSLKPVTSSMRGVVLIDRSTLWKGRPVKALTCGKKSTVRRRLEATSSSRRVYIRLKEGAINLEGGL